MKPLAVIAAAALAAGILAPAQAQSPTTMRVAGNFSSNTKHVDSIEKPFFVALWLPRVSFD